MLRDNDDVGGTIKAQVSLQLNEYLRKTHQVERGDSLFGVVAGRLGQQLQPNT
jgi:hypothetical protein